MIPRKPSSILKEKILERRKILLEGKDKPSGLRKSLLEDKKRKIMSEERPYVVLKEEKDFLNEKYNVLIEEYNSLKDELNAYKVANSRLALKLENCKKVIRVFVEDYLPLNDKVKDKNVRGIVLRAKDNEEKTLDKEFEEKYRNIAKNYTEKFNRLSKKSKKMSEQNEPKRNILQEVLVKKNEGKDDEQNKGVKNDKTQNLSPYITAFLQNQ